MKKHTKEYAEVLALADVNGEIRNYLDLCVKRGFARGYIAAVEENVVEDFISLADHVIRYANAQESINNGKISIALKVLKMKAESLKKATS